MRNHRQAVSPTHAIPRHLPGPRHVPLVDAQPLSNPDQIPRETVEALQLPDARPQTMRNHRQAVSAAHAIPRRLRRALRPRLHSGFGLLHAPQRSHGNLEGIAVPARWNDAAAKFGVQPAKFLKRYARLPGNGSQMDRPLHGNLFVVMSRLKISVKTEQRGMLGNNHGSHEFGNVVLGFPTDETSPRNFPEIPTSGFFNRPADFPGPGVVCRQGQGP